MAKDISIYQTMVNIMTKKSYIWDIYIRISHILMIVLMALLYISSEFGSLLDFHTYFGVALGIVVVFRVVYGFVGSRYARFIHFNLSIKELILYINNIKQTKKYYIGHNPASSYGSIAIMIVLLLVIISGMVAYGIQDNKGIFYFLHDEYYKDMRVFKEIHEAISSVLVVLVGLHMLGVLIDKLYHKQDTLDSMISGYKNVENVGINKSIWQYVYMSILLLSISILAIKSIQKDTIITKSYYEPIDYNIQSPLMAKECGSCHLIYPPYLLPQQSWGKMMDTLSTHFGVDASLDTEDEQIIREYLYANSAEKSTQKSAVYTLRSLKDKDTIAITKTPYWKKVHNDIEDAKAKCTNCHNDIKYGTIENNNIKGLL